MQTTLQDGSEVKKGFSPRRFQTARSTLFVDRFMTHFIKAGGIGIIAAVFGIFIFICSQIVPLFLPARVQEKETLVLPSGSYKVLDADEWGEAPFAVDDRGVVSFLDRKTGKISHRWDPASEFKSEVTAFSYNSVHEELAYGLADGTVVTAAVKYLPVYEKGERKITSEIVKTEPVRIAPEGSKIIRIAAGGDDEEKLLGVIVESGGTRQVFIAGLERQTNLFGSTEYEETGSQDLSGLITGIPETILVNSRGTGLVLSSRDGQIQYIEKGDEGFERAQAFTPFAGTADRRIASMNYLFGEVSLVVTNPQGLNRIFSLGIPHGEVRRTFIQTKEFEPLSGGAEFYSASLRNKAFLIGRGREVSLRYATTEKIRWQKTLPFEVSLAALGRKYDSFYLLDRENRLHFYGLRDPHPEAGLKAFFGKIWYEGYAKPGYEWQSSGASDDFEPKLSLIPLIIGTLKGTFFALFFALPVAVLAAVYTSQFAAPKFKAYIKPCMEIMASLPSVVLGFLAALWLAPIIEDRVPSLLVIFVLLPAFSMAAGGFWSSLPLKYRRFIPDGFEWIAMIPVLLIVCAAGWHLGPVLEKIFFVIKNPETGMKTADFRLWWPAMTDTPFEQRNSLVVGFMMGFAVIPIIFTISEDALSNVPKALSSGSLALGASRWQTAMRVVVPTAFPGIFSALMIGLGRAIGETMIVVMATGNTPVMDFNIFTGMRTLSANIAVELPEAPYLGTLYRTLFFGAMVLFMLTFIMNTAAEIIRQRLREKYRTV